MEKTSVTRDKIYQARLETVAQIRKRFTHKCFVDLPVFHWSVLQLDADFKQSVFEKRPAVWLMETTSEEGVEYRIWQQGDVKWTSTLKQVAFNTSKNQERNVAQFIAELKKRISSEALSERCFLIYAGNSDPSANPWPMQFEAECWEEEN